LTLGLGTTSIVNLSQKTDGFETWFRPVFWVWTALLVLSVVGPVYHGWKSVGVPAELDYGEGPLMWQVQNLFDPSRSYGSLENGPLVIWNYPPAYLLAVRAVWEVQGDLLWSGRFVSYLSGLGVEFLLAAIIYGVLPRRFGRWVRMCAAGTGLLFLCTDAAFLWFPLMRVDLLGLLATYLGVYLFVSAGEKHWKEYLAFGCFFVAAYSKQTFLSAPIACFLATLVVAPRRALRLGFLLALSGGAVFWIGMIWTHGGFARHLILYNVHKFSVGRALSGVTTNLADVRLFFVPLGVLVVVAVLRVQGARLGRFLKLWRARLRRSPLSMALVVEMIHWFLSFLLSFSYGKSGATFNYFLESNAALCVLAGLVLGILLWEVKRMPRLTAAAALVLALPVVLVGQNLYIVINSFVPGELVRMHQGEQMEAYRQFTPRVSSTSKPVLSDDMVLLMRAGKDVVFEPATMCLMAEVGTWDLSGFERRMEAGDFGAIIVSRPDIWDPRLLAALRKSYQLDGTSGRYQLYLPR
jgi:hypothetical protein